MIDRPRRLSHLEREQVLTELAQRQGTPWEREQARNTGRIWVGPQRAAEMVADALTEEARYGKPQHDGNPVVDADIDAALLALVDARQAAEVAELCVLHGARQRGRTWEQIAELMVASTVVPSDAVTPDQARRRYAELKRRHPDDIILRASAEDHDTPAAP
uniref:hypothetical protein n=1 Tax=Nonomuraea sp. CA-252377 TaxID=3240003 RepID=UPI003F49485A